MQEETPAKQGCWPLLAPTSSSYTSAQIVPTTAAGSSGLGNTNQATPPCALQAASPPQCPPLSSFLLTWTSVFNPSLRPTSSTKPFRPHSVPKGLRDVCLIHHQAGYSRDHGKSAVPPSLAQTDTTPRGPQMRVVTTGCHCPGSAAPLKVVQEPCMYLCVHVCEQHVVKRMHVWASVNVCVYMLRVLT